MNTINTTHHYHDFHGLQQMRHDAKNNDQETLQAVAKQLEGVFMNMVLKSMREANNAFKSELFSSSNTDFYHEMHDQQLALSLSNNGSIGLSDMLVKQLSPAGLANNSNEKTAISKYLDTANM